MRGSQALRTAAALVLVVAGLKAGASFLLPLLIAAFLAMATWPIVKLLKRWLPDALAIVLSFVTVVFGLAFLSVMMGGSIANFTASLPQYEERFNELGRDAGEWLRGLGVDIPEDKELDLGPEPEDLLRMISSFLQSLVSALSNAAVVLLLMIFMLFEANGLPDKMRRVLKNPEEDLAQAERITDSVTGYLSVKTGMSLVTGILWGIFLGILGVDFPVLWGLVAFLFNYIPNIGSVIAAIPPIMLALLQGGPSLALGVVAGNIGINQVMGNVIEPRLMGRRLGLATLVVFISLLFWSWIFGPIGMILSVPLTMVVKIALEQTEDYKGIAAMLGPADEEPPSNQG